MVRMDQSSEDLSGGEIESVEEAAGGGATGDGEENVMIDMDMILDILQEPSDPSHNSAEDSLNENLQAESAPQNDYGMLERQQDGGENESFNPARGYPLYSPECSDGRIVPFDGSVEYSGSSSHVFGVGADAKAELLPQISPPSFKKWGRQGTEMVRVLQSANPSSSSMSNLDEGSSHHGINGQHDLQLGLLLCEPGNQLQHMGGQISSQDALSLPWMECSDRLEFNGASSSEPENDANKSVDISFVDGYTSQNVLSTNSTSCHNSDVTSELGAHYSAMQLGSNGDYSFFDDGSPDAHISGDYSSFDFFTNNDGVMTNERDELAEFQTESACSVSQFSPVDYHIKGLNFKSEGSSYSSPMSGNFFSNDSLVDDKALEMPFGCYRQSDFGNKEVVYIKDEEVNGEAALRGMTWHSSEASDVPPNGNYYCSDETNVFNNENLKQSSSVALPSTQSQKHSVYTNDEKGDINVAYMRTQIQGSAVSFPTEGAHIDFNGSSQYSPRATPSNISNSQLTCIIDGREGKTIQPKVLGSHLSRVSPESIQSNSSGGKSRVDDDYDICILEDISQPACTNQAAVPFVPLHQSPSPITPFQRSAYGDSLRPTGMAGMRVRPNDERFIFQAALQDLSQPKSEASPPDGVLAVPLLRHQRIALSWMVQKETSSIHCSGGILADDQGLGKTVSTIALILKERPPHLKVDTKLVKKEEFETLDLDEDDDEVKEVDGVKKVSNGIHIIPNPSSTRSMTSVVHSKGRPSAGTLVVCPTSVLRQWAEELHKKVTNEANLSVLVYHGSNRTKDPSELAKYDVVLTTYSIVSMEVPKQPLVDDDEEEKGRRDGDDVQHLGLSFGKKRKYPPSSGKKGSKNKKGMDSAMLESVARPLAKVGWFRVVLDEAQSIKNHRTQVARACWGLRAKRRWCLSGTPIQNAIDDLYSYFRFLRYDPYAVYNSFCSTIKVPIQRSPTKGYRKLQAVLKTIMLRRTKGTLLDGKPIINLPPKVVKLEKVDFTEEERDFYTKLEADSRAQFKEYAAAGTVKQNYVNILLMLLRLRQACDHRLLVTGIDSSSLGKSSIEMAKKLPREKQICLLNCLEASLAICGICNDPPEDAVVSICGHVFCNQCIYEHLSGDDHQCPTSNCKIRLNVSSVFSKAALNSSLSDQLGLESSGSDLVDAHSLENPYDSSKIRAALKVLQSLTKPQDLSSARSSLENSSNGDGACPAKPSGSGCSLNVDIDGGSSSVKVVGEKAIVFSQWTKMLDLLEACLKHSSIQYRRLDGTMSVVARDKAVKDFNTLPEVTVMIMSLKAASLGLNMVAACRVLLLDLWWNPTTEDQAIDRAHRIGQTRPVTVLRLTVNNTVEDRILALQEKKREMVASAFGEDENASRQTRLTVEDLNYLFMV